MYFSNSYSEYHIFNKYCYLKKILHNNLNIDYKLMQNKFYNFNYIVHRYHLNLRSNLLYKQCIMKNYNLDNQISMVNIHLYYLIKLDKISKDSLKHKCLKSNNRNFSNSNSYSKFLHKLNSYYHKHNRYLNYLYSQ